MPESVFFHIYTSTAAKPFTQVELVDLLKVSRTNNEKLGLTGMMLYKHGDFMQVLEGPETVVRELLLKIRRDPRHHSISRTLDGYYCERQFPEWQMGFNDLNSEEAKSTSGYSQFLNTPLSASLAAQPTVAQSLLHLFKKRLR